MIPPFDNRGNLPPGIHTTTLREVESRFTATEWRKHLFEGLKRLLQNLKKAGCSTLYLDGSFITSKVEPADYDCIWDPTGVSALLDKDLLSPLEKMKEKYYGDIFVYVPEAGGFPYLDYFQRDQDDNLKGIIRIDLRKSL